eukprot:TRINITY_DN6516_c0_g1_i1.p2 TRINITY_DN6516_c0_g1~~TRINITY_DN6516_c0_g1_i1.p2  ORF type:complete len:280 (+),score=73.07 TRINITY_DN6516_c0_g1_i1:30-842(+)
MSNADQITEGAALQTYLVLAKNSKGKACTAVIQQALSAPNVFVFGELLENPNVQQLAGTEDAKYLELLKIFAYGTYADYKNNSTSLPQLSHIQARKLKQLTIVTLAASSKMISYDLLQQELDITGLRELEDLIIEAIYLGLVAGKLDQKQKTFEVESAMGRDLKPENIDDLIDLLTNWSVQSDNLLKSIKEKIQHANIMNDQEKKHREEYEKRVENVKSSLKAAMDSDNMMHMQPPDFDGGEFFGGIGQKGGSRAKPKSHRDHHRDRRGV